MFVFSPVDCNDLLCLRSAGFDPCAVAVLVWSCCGFVIGQCGQLDQVPARSLFVWVAVPWELQDNCPHLVTWEAFVSG